MFNPGWQQNLRIDYGDIAWAATGERLRKESFEKYRKQGGWVIMHMMKDENVERALAHPHVMIMPFAESTTASSGITHVLVNGTFVVRNGQLVADARPGKPVRVKPE